MVVREKDYIQQLADYVKRNLSKGYTIDTLRWALVKQGRNRTEIERAITLAQQQMAANAPKFQAKPQLIVDRKEEKQEKKEGFFARIVSWFKG
ncbi:hypothetical protein HZA33_05155 [Candidatus Pacearchaeota archaeon]|nr:hypothetical protein [Candidatus Pacearchaeota archaeon]